MSNSGSCPVGTCRFRERDYANDPHSKDIFSTVGIRQGSIQVRHRGISRAGLQIPAVSADTGPGGKGGLEAMSTRNRGTLIEVVRRVEYYRPSSVCCRPSRISARQPNCPLRVDAVEKGGGIQPAHNNRIMGASFLNRSCGFDARVESMLLGAPPQNLFQQQRSFFPVFPFPARNTDVCFFTKRPFLKGARRQDDRRHSRSFLDGSDVWAGITLWMLSATSSGSERGGGTKYSKTR